MNVKTAKAIAHHWVNENASQIPGFAGAFFHGSINWLVDEDTLPATSDVDLMIMLAGASPTVKLGKFIYHDLLLEVSYLTLDELRSPELLVGQSHLAGSFRPGSIIADPTGQLTPVQAAVTQAYTKRESVYRRCAHARDKILNNLQSLQADAPFHDQVSAWLFAAGLTTHVLLVAGLKNPTVRKRYLAVRTLLADYGHADFYPSLLDLLGCAQMSQARAEEHLLALTAVFDVAKTVIKTPFFFASDISDLARPIAIDGSRQLIERGDQREAIFWLVATYARCQKVLAHDASPEVADQFTPGFRRLLGDLGITSFVDLQRRGQQVEAFLPRLWVMAEVIINANPAIEAG